MGLTKRYIHPTLDYVAPQIESDTDKFLILMNLAQATNTGILEQLSALFEYTHEVFTEITEEASETSKRIKSLGQRVATLQETLPQIDENVYALQSLQNIAVSYSNKSEEVACQFMAEQRVAAIVHQYQECMPPPNLGLLDVFAGESCLKKYTNPMFFLETWVEQQRLIYEEAKKKRAERRKGRKRRGTTVQKIAVKQVELSRAKFNAMGQEFASPSTPTSAPNSERKMESLGSDSAIAAPAARIRSAKKDSKKPAVKAEKKPSKPSEKTSSSSKSTSSSSSGSKSSKSGSAIRSDKKEKDRSKKTSSSSSKLKKHPTPTEINEIRAPNTDAPPPPVVHDDLPLPPSHLPPPPPSDIPGPPTNMPPPPPSQTIPSPPVAAVPPPPTIGLPPPPSNIPPPPASGGLAAALTNKTLKAVEPGEKKPVEKRSALLESIQQGTNLRKVEPATQPKHADNTGFNVAKILARRAAIECSDSEDDSEDNEWDD